MAQLLQLAVTFRGDTGSCCGFSERGAARPGREVAGARISARVSTYGRRAPRASRLVAGPVVFGVLFYLFNRFTAGNHHDGSWPAATVAIASYAAGFGIAMRFLATWSLRRELRSHDAPDDAVDAPHC